MLGNNLQPQSISSNFTIFGLVSSTVDRPTESTETEEEGKGEGRSRNGTAETKRKRLAKKRPQDGKIHTYTALPTVPPFNLELIHRLPEGSEIPVQPSLFPPWRCITTEEQTPDERRCK